MKKVSVKLKRHWANQSRHELNRRQRLGGKTKERERLFPKDARVFEILKAPSNFSFLENTEEVLEYFKKAGKLFSNRQQVHFDLTDVKNLTPASIALLIAKIKDPKFTRKLDIRGNKPKNEKLAKLFDDSGFLDYVNAGYYHRPTSNLLIHQVTQRKVEPLIAKKVGILAVKHTFRKDIIFSPIYKVMIEAMANTDNHASLGGKGHYNWWIFTYCEPKTHITSFTFLDLGVGIFNSGPVTDYIQKIRTVTTSVRKLSSYNLEVVPDLFSGDIYTSRTGEKDRGQGLPTIKEMSTDKKIKNFIIISNNIKIVLPSLKSNKIDSNFNGTLLYWELHP